MADEAQKQLASFWDANRLRVLAKAVVEKFLPLTVCYWLYRSVAHINHAQDAIAPICGS